jgi:phosphate:Na+ symporter
MDFLEKRAVVNLVERKDRALELVGFENEKRTYYPAMSMWLKLEQLQLVQQLVEPLDGDRQPILSTSLHGVAHFDGQELSIIGAPQQATRMLQVNFEARDVSTADRLGLRALEDELGNSMSDVALGTARLGFNPADDETGEPDQWWLACHIPPACLAVLAKAISDGQLGAVELGLTMRNLYTSEGPSAEPARQPRLFLRPNESDDAIEWPNIATGYVTHLRIDFATVSLRGSATSGDQEGGAKVVADAVNSLGPTLLNLRLTVRWIGILIAVLLFLEVLERLQI